MNQALNQLKRIGIFTTVVETGSFTAAANRLQMNRAKVSENISTLERALGVRLFQRTTRKLSITPEGERLFAQTSQLLPQTMLAIDGVQQASGNLEGRLRVSTTHDLAEWVLSPFLGQFLSDNPGIELSLNLQDLPVDMLDSQMDVVIRGGVPKDSSLIGQTIAPLSLQLVATRDYLSQYGIPGTLDDLTQHRGIWLSQLGSMDKLMMTSSQGTQQSLQLSAWHYSDSPSGMAMLTRQGLGIGLLPKFVVGQFPGDLVPVLESWSYDEMQLSVLYPSRLALPARTRAFIEQFKQWLQVHSPL